MTVRLPTKVVHSDWSTTAAKRWGAEATLDGDRYVVAPPSVVTNPIDDAIRTGVSTLLGFDFPIGLLAAYCEKVGVTSFVELLPELGWGKWRDFFTPAATRDEISLYRPFYPRRPGGTSHQHLLDGLGFSSMEDLRRVCERAHGSRRAAQVIFWTLGGNQVGPAAIAGWREMLIPSHRELTIWPFAGTLDELVGEGVVVCETYPAEFYGHLGLPVNKTEGARRSAAPGVLAAAQSLRVDLYPDLLREIERGFANDDAYDAFVGLLGMINVVVGNRPEAPRLDEEIQRVEGWILGQSA
jgi:hypothetical protein